MDSTSYLVENPTHGNITLHIRVTPNAKRTALLPGLHKDVYDVAWLRVALAAKPQDNAANKALIHFLARKLNHPKSRIHIISGTHDRYKKTLLDQPSEETRAYIHQLHTVSSVPDR